MIRSIRSEESRNRIARIFSGPDYYRGLIEPLELSAFKTRHQPVLQIDRIDATDTYYLGYIVQAEIEKKLQLDANDPEALKQKARLEDTRKRGAYNHNAYLVSDHLDIYVATSMRKRHEYVEIAEFTSKLFQSEKLQDLNLRWFDPTLAYCPDRIDKGLSEALMLKRARCTLYLAQESDTLGKDSELASTLAQGKPVIAYVPSPSEVDVRKSVHDLSLLYGRSTVETILDRLQTLAPSLAWTDPEVRQCQMR